MMFPMCEGTTLDGRAVTLPRAFTGTRTLVTVVFDRTQLDEATTWVPVLQYLGARYPDLRSYRAPVLGELNAVARFGLEKVMRATTSDPQLRAATIPLYVDRDAFCRALDLPGPERVAVLLVDGTGRVPWRGVGPYTDQAQATDLERAVAAGVA